MRSPWEEFSHRFAGIRLRWRRAKRRLKRLPCIYTTESTIQLQRTIQLLTTPALSKLIRLQHPCASTGALTYFLIPHAYKLYDMRTLIAVVSDSDSSVPHTFLGWSEGNADLTTQSRRQNRR